MPDRDAHLLLVHAQSDERSRQVDGVADEGCQADCAHVAQHHATCNTQPIISIPVRLTAYFQGILSAVGQETQLCTATTNSTHCSPMPGSRADLDSESAISITMVAMAPIVVPTAAA